MCLISVHFVYDLWIRDLDSEQQNDIKNAYYTEKHGTDYITEERQENGQTMLNGTICKINEVMMDRTFGYMNRECMITESSSLEERHETIVTACCTMVDDLAKYCGTANWQKRFSREITER